MVQAFKPSVHLCLHLTQHDPESVFIDRCDLHSPTAQGTAAGYSYLFGSHDSSKWDILLQSQHFKYLTHHMILCRSDRSKAQLPVRYVSFAHCPSENARMT